MAIYAKGRETLPSVVRMLKDWGDGDRSCERCGHQVKMHDTGTCTAMDSENSARFCGCDSLSVAD